MCVRSGVDAQSAPGVDAPPPLSVARVDELNAQADILLADALDRVVGRTVRMAIRSRTLEPPRQDTDALEQGRIPHTNDCSYCGLEIGGGCYDGPHLCDNGYECVQQCRDENNGICRTFDVVQIPEIADMEVAEPDEDVASESADRVD